MTKYVCRECTGRTGEEHSLEVEREPNRCPWCGQKKLSPAAEYWKARYNDADREKERYEEQAWERKQTLNKIKELAKKVESGMGWSEDEKQKFLEQFNFDDD